MTRVSLSTEQIELLKACAAAYEVPHSRTGQKEGIMFYTAMGVGTQIQHHGFPEPGMMSTSLGDLEELSDYRFFDIRYGKTDHQGTFRVTGSGYQAVAQIGEQEQALAEPGVVPEEGRAMGLKWQTEVLPVLVAVNELYPSAPKHRGVSQDAINERLGREQGDEHTGLVLRKLEEQGYIVGKLEADQVEGPLFCEPAGKALELLSGWPTERGDAAFAQLIQSLEKKIEETSDEAEKSKLRQVLTSVREVSQGIMVAVLSDVIRGE